MAYVFSQLPPPGKGHVELDEVEVGSKIVSPVQPHGHRILVDASGAEHPRQ